MDPLFPFWKMETEVRDSILHFNFDGGALREIFVYFRYMQFYTKWDLQLGSHTTPSGGRRLKFVYWLTSKILYRI